MAQKNLNVSLFYKNKKLDTIIEKRDFSGKFVIGTDPNLFWQILDNSFPKQHTLLVKKGSKYQVNLHRSMALNVKKGDSSLSLDDLKSSRLVKGNTLTLDPSIKGTVDFADNWQISFGYEDVYVHRPSAEELRIIKQFGKYSELIPVVKYTVRFLILALLATIVGVFFVNERLEKWHSAMTKVTGIKELAETRRLVKIAKAEMPEQYTTYTEEDAGKGEEKTEKKEEKPAKTEEKPKDFASVFGSGAGISTETEVEDIKFVQQTTVVNIAVKGGIGADDGNASGTGGDAKSGSAKKFESAFGSSTASLADYKGSTVGSLKDVASSDILGSASGLNLTEVKGSIAGTVGDSKIATIKSDKDMAAIKKQFDAFATKITESDDQLSASYEGGSAATGNSDAARIQQLISSYSDRLTRIFNAEFRREKIWGSVRFTIYIESNGKVLGVDIEPYGKSRMNDSVISKFRNEILSWKFKVSGRTSYVFTRIFTQQ